MSDLMDHISDPAKAAIDALSVLTVVGTLAQMLPSVAAIFTIIWTGIRIAETETVRSLFRKKDDGL
jgi:hypothetical protein